MNKDKIIPNKTYDKDDHIRQLLDSSYKRIKRLFVLAYRHRSGANRVTADSHRRYFLTRGIYFVTEMKLFISIVLVLNMFLKKLKDLLGIKT